MNRQQTCFEIGYVVDSNNSHEWSGKRERHTSFEILGKY